MAITVSLVTVATTATALSGGGTDDGREGQSIAVYNPGPSTVYLGGASVTASTGWPVAAGEKEAFDLATNMELPHAITTSGTQQVRVLRLGA